MRFEQIEWHSGKVIFWDLAFLDPQKSLMDQVDHLKEDLVQVQYHGGVILDIGWYPEFSPDGSFVVKVVRESDWNAPLLEEQHRNLEDLWACVERATLIAKEARTTAR